MSKTWKWVLGVVALLIVVVGVSIYGVIRSTRTKMARLHATDIYTYALARAQAHPSAQRLGGIQWASTEFASVMAGSSYVKDDKAKFLIREFGNDTNATIFVEAHKEGGVWVYDQLAVAYDRDALTRIDLREAR